MDESLKAILMHDMLSSQRNAHAVHLQGVMSHQLLSVQALANHQTSAHFLDMILNRDTVEMSIPEAAAVGNMSSGQLPEKVAGLNTGNSTPSSPGSTAQQTGTSMKPG